MPSEASCSWGLSGPPVAFRGLLALPVASWGLLWFPEAFWSFLGPPGASWDILWPLESFCGLLMPPGTSCGLLGPPGACWSLLWHPEKNLRPRAWPPKQANRSRHPQNLAHLGGENERLARDILQICSESEGCWAQKQANRLRHPHKMAANEPVQPPLAAPLRGAEMSASLETSSNSAPKAKDVGHRNTQTA